VLDVEPGGDAGVLILGLDAEEAHPHPVDPPPRADRLDPAEWEQPAAELRQHLVEVGDGQRRCHGLVAALGEHDPVRIEQVPVLLGGVDHLPLGQRHEPPVVLPGGVVDLDESPRLRFQIPLAKVADGDAMLGLELFRQLPDHR
jgi:hypothetical protein